MKQTKNTDTRASGAPEAQHYDNLSSAAIELKRQLDEGRIALHDCRRNAERLAEALKDVLPYAEGYASSAGAIERATEALAAWEGAK